MVGLVGLEPTTNGLRIRSLKRDSRYRASVEQECVYKCVSILQIWSACQDLLYIMNKGAINSVIT
jgi:hypothetical protein